MTHRHKGGPPELTYETVNRYGGLPPVINGSHTSLAQYSHREMTGQNIAGFHRRKKAGELLPFTNFNHVEIEGKASGTVTTVMPGSGDTWYYDGSRTMTDMWVITDAEILNKLDGYSADRYVQAAAARIYASGWDTLTFLAELKDVRRMFETFVRNLAKIIRKSKWNKPKKGTKTGVVTKGTQLDPTKVEDTWMEGRYGWRVLIYDIIDIANALASLDEKRKRYMERTGRTFTDVDVDVSTQTWSTSTQEWTVTTTWETSVRGSVVADITPPKFSFNPFTTAWELVTLSFVIDWVVSVGAALNAASFLVLSTRHHAAAGWRTDVTRVCQLTDVTWIGGHTGVREQSSQSEGYIEMRVPVSVSLLPQLQLNVDWLKVGDLLALLRQAMK